MNISQAAQKTGLSAKSIRFYEDKQLISPPSRGANGYRLYSDKHIQQLQLIARARHAGFSLDECRALLKLAEDPERTSAEVKQHACEKLAEIENKIRELEAMRVQLESWISICPGDGGKECPIIDELCSGKKEK